MLHHQGHRGTGKSIRAERADVEFRSFAPVEIEAITGQMGDKVVVAHPGQPVHWGIAVNVDKKPFDDVRVRQALSLALDRAEMAKTIGTLTGLDTVGGPMPPGTPWPWVRKRCKRCLALGTIMRPACARPGVC